MKYLLITLLMLSATFEIKSQTGQAAPDFTATAIDGSTFRLSDLKGKKIHLSFYRNGACALCNLRVHEIVVRQKEFDDAGIVVVAVFESSIEDMKPFVGKQQPGFTLLADPEGKIYDLYKIKNSPELINQAMTSTIVGARVQQAAAAGFNLTKQEGSNFFRIPAEVLIDKNFVVKRFHHADQLADHLPIDEILKF